MRRTRPRALVCTYHAPQEDRDSGARRIFHFLDFLQKARWDVSFLASDGVGETRDVRVLEQRGITVYDGGKDEAERLFRTSQFDLALIAFWSNAERYLPVIREVSPTTRVIVDSVDLHFLREARYVLHDRAREDSLHAKLLDGNYGARFVREMNAYAAADGVLTVSPKEAGLIGDVTGDAALAYAVPDCEAMARSPVPFHRRRGILSVGSFQHKPNIQAVEYLCKQILPLIDPAILAAHPVYVVGNGLNQTVRAFGRGLPSVRMVGWVPAVGPYFAQTRISVVPLLYGAGTKRKLIQSMMTGTPAVATSIGVEGLNLRHGQHVLVADDPQSFADAIAQLLTDEKLWRRIAQAGRSYIAPAHSPVRARTLLLAAIDAVLQKTPMRLVPLGDARRPEDYSRDVVPGIRQTVAESLPPQAAVVVVSRGDAELLKLNGAAASHFPQGEGGVYAGQYPADSAAAIAHLEDVRGKGGEFLLFPNTAFWWLEHYGGFKQHLENRYRRVAHKSDTCIIYDLRNGKSEPVSEFRSPAARPDPPDVKLVALYLPQFHPIPENDAWWGEGFTEWRNVAKAEPLFPGHCQPHIPADLGFYDLRLAETRQEQADLARDHGIHGFCYYHYWFHGKLLLERPFAEVLASGKPDFPFCLCWANDPWSRRWDGREDDLLQAQTYSDDDDLAHIRWLIPALEDPRAIRIDGKAVFLIYRGRHLPDAARTIDTWRREVSRAGLRGIYLVAMETAWDLGWDATTVGFDAKVLFQPQFSTLITSVPSIRIPGKDNLQVYDYREAWRVLGNLDPVPYTRYDCVFPGWDNSARVGDHAVVLQNSSPADYEEVLHRAIVRARSRQDGQRLVFINAWNEWAEGCHLEPDARHGTRYLEATSRALTRPTGAMAPPVLTGTSVSVTP